MELFGIGPKFLLLAHRLVRLPNDVEKHISNYVPVSRDSSAEPCRLQLASVHQAAIRGKETTQLVYKCTKVQVSSESPEHFPQMHQML